MDLIQPTEDEVKNGWTPETLTKYVNERKEAQSRHAGIIPEIYKPWGERLDPNRPRKTESRYNPMRW